MLKPRTTDGNHSADTGFANSPYAKRCLLVFLLAVLAMTVDGRSTASQCSAIPTYNLVAYYPFSGNASDQSGNGHNGVVRGATLAPDRFGHPDRAYYFDGTDDIVVFPGLDWNTAASFTTALWFKWRSKDFSVMLEQGNGSRGSICMNMAKEVEPQKVRVCVMRPTDGLWYSANRAFDDTTQWHHLALVYDKAAGAFSQYLDGILTDSQPIDTVFDLSDTVSAGQGIGNYGGAGFFNGGLDEIRIYSRALSDSEVCALANEPAEGYTVWIDSTTVAKGYSQVMMRNIMDVSAFTIPLIHDSPYPIDSVSRVGCRIENWESFNKTINNPARTVLIGGIANAGGGTPCMTPGEGCLAKIYWHKTCDTLTTVNFDTTFIAPVAHLLLVDCAAPGNEFTPPFIKGPSQYRSGYIYGDANGNGIVNIGDPVYLVSYIFAGGPEPIPSPCAGDANGDCLTNISDAVYLINYIFVPGASAPVAYCSGPHALGKSAAVNVEIGSTSKLSDQFNTLTLSAAAGQQIKGAQLEFATSGNVEIVEVTSNVTGMQEFHGTVDGTFKVGLLDMTGETAIPAGTNDMITIKYKGTGKIELVNAIMVGTDAAEMNVIIASGKSGPSLPTAFSLAQNCPNPFNPTTEIAFSLPAAAQVQLDILNIVGQRVRTLVDEFRAAGNHSVVWDSRDDNGNTVSSGVYFYRLRAGEYTDTRKMVLMK